MTPHHLTARGTYRGWTVAYAPVGSQHWQARKHGVTMRGNSRELLLTMIDLRMDADDSQEWPR